ncbi:MAG: CRISPR-associated endonuclease Cas2 [Candidatus Taylorbacteria bacterium RIFCSPLOWO2_02_FULL_43_11]|uniref:CRISPR-associated endonuclease Cas2 n=1 Tax=Candidatus Taylorbacteria bacterium RIFCSPHIGHO2_02_FULL_43_32b TaxID=1802306 RepID=A0A1G2MKM9_9BACT|nr:MAG: CRISPR-associated endonuclease Cas2 [Candidatus Taylorbacteria bacterium RIFCSPHIGHO2_01_FULL_43_47]OHA24427.1 MAG: CRISPR-associated endonuclease Cas2 [Candidatus Taylorbacteria bacterium RIFCSPHIGHO2_02_FULL_43_32b]OHA31555.1 MAG: CRISPR-associated endonuclease Cas2 [Candidatus Taylorbacteria bacterium RIFCSPLOWO2_01_FULL_43_44]OHA35322.1 MAG: CRISPR-associated endonuclease Cas2 [Candidatus Taylorbacteria bacterium RIFCSPLOWO2_02_FULL_43_11]
MEKLEASSKRVKRANLKKALLLSVAAAGVLSVTLLAPNALQALEKMGIINFKKRQKEFINVARERLVEQGLLTKDSRGLLQLTAKGKQTLRRLELTDFQFKKPKKWDKKWRVLIFDIPEYRRALREKVRRTLRAIGFVRVQDSVWVYPYPCEDLITLLKADFKVGKDILYLVAEEMEYSFKLKKFFGLVD